MPAEALDLRPVDELDIRPLDEGLDVQPIEQGRFGRALERFATPTGMPELREPPPVAEASVTLDINAPPRAIPRSPEELAQARQASGIPEPIHAARPQDLTAPYIPLGRVKAEEEQGEVVPGYMGIPTRKSISPLQAAVVNKALEFGEFAESPAGFLTAGAGAVGPTARALIGLGYSADMLRQLPTAVDALKQAGEEGTPQEVWEAGLGVGINAALGTSLGRHGVAGLLPRTMAEVGKPTAKPAPIAPPVPEVPTPDFSKLPVSPVEPEPVPPMPVKETPLTSGETAGKVAPVKMKYAVGDKISYATFGSKPVGGKWQSEKETATGTVIGLREGGKLAVVPDYIYNDPVAAKTPEKFAIRVDPSDATQEVAPVKTETLAKGMAIEAHDHPALTAIPGAIEQVAQDELRLDPEAYKGEQAPKPTAPEPTPTVAAPVKHPWLNRNSLRNEYDSNYTAAQFNSKTGRFEVVERATGESHDVLPWQMSQNEFESAFPVEQGKGVNAFAAWAGSTEPNRAGRYKYHGKWYDRGDTSPLRQEHRALVEKALAEGKPAPPEVLADYPELAPKAQPAAAAATERTENATNQRKVEESVLSERERTDAQRQAAEAGASDSLRRAEAQQQLPPREAAGRDVAQAQEREVPLTPQQMATAKAKIRKHYDLKRPVTDAEVMDEIKMLRRHAKAGTLDDANERLLSALSVGKDAFDVTAETPPQVPLEPKGKARVGMRFFHKHIYDPTLMPEKVPQMFEVSAIRKGKIYYRPVYRYEGGRIEVGKAKDYTTPERWEKVFGREATAEESAYGKTIPATVPKQSGEAPAKVPESVTPPEGGGAVKPTPPAAALAETTTAKAETQVEPKGAEEKTAAIRQSKTVTAKLKAQREYLASAVEGAIRQAPEDITAEQRAAILAEDRNQLDAIEKDFALKQDELRGQAGYAWYETDEGKALLAAREAALEPLFAKYGIAKQYPASEEYLRMDQTRAAERIAGEYDLSGRERMLGEAIKQAVENQLPHIVIQVPGDGDFTIINTKTALRAFLETVKKDFPVSAPRGPVSKTNVLGPKPIAPVPAKLNVEDALKAVQTHLSTDETRYTLQYAYSNGSELVATDGRRLIRVIGDFGGTETNPIWYKEGKPDAKMGKTQRFPNYGQIIPTETWILKGGQDTAELIRLVRLAKSATSETSNSVKLWRNTDGTLGVTASSPESAEYSGNMKEGANVIAAFNPDYLLEGLEASRRLGSEKVDLYSSRQNDVELSPMVIRGKNHEIILMPMRLEGTPEGIKPGIGDIVKSARRDVPVHKSNLPSAKSPAEPSQPILSEAGKFSIGPYYHVEVAPDGIKISHRSREGDPWTEETIERNAWPTTKDKQMAAAREALGWQRTLEPADAQVANRQADVLVKKINGLIKQDAANAKKAAKGSSSPIPPEHAGPGIVGMGAAISEEFGKPGDFVSNMFAAIAQEREAMGKPPMPDVKGRAWDEDNKIALTRMNRDPNWIPDLIKSVTAKPRPLASWEMAGMVWQKAKWKAEANNALARIARAFDDDRKADLTEAQQDVARFEDNLDELEKAVFKGGTGSEAGRSLQAQKMAAGEDFTLVEMRLQKRFSANKGGPLTPAQEAEVAKAYAELYAARKAAAASELKAQEAEAARVLAELKAKSVPAFDKRILDYAEGIVSKMETAADAAAKRLRAKFSTPGLLSGPLDPTVLDDFAIWGSAKIARLGLDAARFTDLAVREFSEKVRPYISEIWNAANKRLEEQLSKAPPKVRSAIKQKSEVPPLEVAKQLLVEKAKAKVNADVAYQVRKLCRALIADNPAITREELITEVQGVLQQAIPDITRRDTLKAISGYGEFKQLTKDQISVTLRDLKGQIQQVAKLEDMAKKTAPEKTGIERREPSDEERRLIKLVNEAKIMGGYKVTDPATQLKSVLQTFKTRTRNAIVDLERRLAEGNFEVRQRRPLELDAESLRLQADYKRLKDKWKEELRKNELANRAGWQKALDAFVKWERAFKLSSPIVFGKLTAAAVTRMHATVAEELVGTVLGKIPVIRRVAEQAPREGPINIPAMAKAFRMGITQGMIDAWKTARKGAADIDVMYGDKLIDRDWANFFGQLHGMMKAPIKRMEFEYSLQKRIEHAIKNGYDASDPLIQARLCAEALNDGYRSIFMQHGFSADMFNMLVNSMEKSTKYQPIGEVSARLARFLFPIVRVPFNIVSETATGVTGVPMASARLMIQSIKGGLKDLSPEVRDSIMRQFKKGSIGLGLVAIGYFSPNFAGGYDWREKEQFGRAKPFQFRVFDYDVPKWVTHAPWFELMQIGATIRRVKEQHVSKTGEDRGIEEGMWAAVLGLIEQTPFVNQIGRLDRVFESESARTMYLGQLARSSIIPQAVTKIAEWTDEDLPEGWKRKPETFLQHVEMGIPVMRRNVPVAMPKVTRTSKLRTLKPLSLP